MKHTREGFILQLKYIKMINEKLQNSVLSTILSNLAETQILLLGSLYLD